jgi:hypothetical protein
MSDDKKTKAIIEKIRKTAIQNLDKDLFYENIKRGKQIIPAIQEAIENKRMQNNVRREITNLVNDRNSKIFDDEYDKNLKKRIEGFKKLFQ